MTRRGLAKHRGVSQFDVGGHKFTILDTDVGKYPSSSLYHMAQTPAQEVQINRSGSLFKHVYMYLQNGQLPRGTDGKVMMDDQTLKELKIEADFYGLDKLSAECDFARQNISVPDFQSYFAIQKYICEVLGEHKDNHHMLTDYYISAVPHLTHALKCLWVPFCAADKLFQYNPLFDVSVSDLVAPAGLSTINVSQNGTFEAAMLNSAVLDKITNQLTGSNVFKEFAPHLRLTLHPKSLVLQQKGFSQAESRVLTTSNSERSVGSVQKAEILKYVSDELKRRDSIVLGLLHQYHYNDFRRMPTVAMLRGGDSILYELLTASGDYEVKLISFTVQYTDGSCFGKPTVKLFSPDTMTVKNPNKCCTYDYEKDFVDGEMVPRQGVPLVMPNVFNHSWVLSEESLEDGDDVRRENLYLLSGLQVSRIR
eukprot:gene15106-17306_t